MKADDRVSVPWPERVTQSGSVEPRCIRESFLTILRRGKFPLFTRCHLTIHHPEGEEGWDVPMSLRMEGTAGLLDQPALDHCTLRLPARREDKPLVEAALGWAFSFMSLWVFRHEK